MTTVMTTLLYGPLETEIPRAAAEDGRLWIPTDDLERATGWTAKPQGLCRGDECVPVPKAQRGRWLDEDGQRVDFAAFAQALGHTLAHDEAHAVWSFGPTVGREAAGAGPVVAPLFLLPDLDGTMHALDDYRGKKVLLFCWASW